MLKIFKDKDGLYSVVNEKGKNVLPKKYEYIDLQEYGIVARNSKKGTFLDNIYDFYDTKGNFLFSKKRGL